MTKAVKKVFLVVITILIIGNVGLSNWNQYAYGHQISNIRNLMINVFSQGLASMAVHLQSTLSYNSNLISGRLEETGSMEESPSLYWWLNSGGIVHVNDGEGQTIQGNLPRFNRWRIAYSLSNPDDTDDGYHPQNLLRLLTRNKWENFSQEAYFKINNYHLSPSVNRNASNGVVFFLRYKDSDNLYYAGLRVDGQAVIKKKLNGTYYTLASKPFYSGTYNRDTNPNLLPLGNWIGIRSNVKTSPDGTVSISLFVDRDHTGQWEPVMEVIDNGTRFGRARIAGDGYAGIRSDFMDLQFDDYKINII